jgi:hypothetical protein
VALVKSRISGATRASTNVRNGWKADVRTRNELAPFRPGLRCWCGGWSGRSWWSLHSSSPSVWLSYPDTAGSAARAVVEVAWDRRKLEVVRRASLRAWHPGSYPPSNRCNGIQKLLILKELGMHWGETRSASSMLDSPHPHYSADPPAPTVRRTGAHVRCAAQRPAKDRKCPDGRRVLQVAA